MSARLASLRASRAETVYEKTFAGRVSVLGRRGMGLYCVFRGVSVSSALPLATIVAKLAKLMRNNEDLVHYQYYFTLKRHNSQHLLPRHHNPPPRHSLSLALPSALA